MGSGRQEGVCRRRVGGTSQCFLTSTRTDLITTLHFTSRPVWLHFISHPVWLPVPSRVASFTTLNALSPGLPSCSSARGPGMRSDACWLRPCQRPLKPPRWDPAPARRHLVLSIPHPRSTLSPSPLQAAMVHEAFEAGARPGGDPTPALDLVALLAATWQARGHPAGTAAGIIASHLCLCADKSPTCSWTVSCLPYALPR